MNRKQDDKPYFFRRVVAYIIDIIFVTLLATAISMVFIDNTNYQKTTEELRDLARKYSEKEITIEEFNEQSETLNYYMAKESVGTTIINCGVAIIYYVVLCYYCHGITLGKYIMKLRLVSANDKELNIGNYLIRALFVDLILSNIINIICVYSMNEETFKAIYPKLSSVLSIFLLATILFIMYREDGRGLHDLMSNTKVISFKANKEKEIKDEIVDAKVIEEKKVEKKTTKKSSKNSKKKEVNK